MEAVEVEVDEAEDDSEGTKGHRQKLSVSGGSNDYYKKSKIIAIMWRL